MAKEIDIKLKTTYDGKGGDKAKKHLNGIADSFSKIGEALGGANSNLGRFMQNFLKGGIWGAAAELVGYGIKKIQEWWQAEEKAAKEAAEAEAKMLKELHEKRMRCLDDYRKAYERTHSVRAKAITDELNAVKNEIDATKELTKATLELEKAKARKSGNKEKVAEIDNQLGDIDYKADVDKVRKSLESIAERRRLGEDKIEDYQGAMKRIREAKKLVKGELWYARREFDYLDHNDEDDKEAWARNEEKVKDLEGRLRDLNNRWTSEHQKREDERTFLKNLDKEEALLKKQLEILSVREKARVTGKEADAAEADRKAAEEKKKAEEKRIADVKAAELKAAAEAAKERERLDREAHKKRMADIRAEIAASAGRGNILKATAANAQNEFDRAFAMYRDPSHAASVIGEEKDYQDDLKRLHRDASRYGGKWRIDELSRLMAAGDSQGVTDTLTAWRRNKNFTSQIEAMVRASAAERTKTAVEDELRKIENNTAGLARKLDELLAMKGD